MPNTRSSAPRLTTSNTLPLPKSSNNGDDSPTATSTSRSLHSSTESLSSRSDRGGSPHHSTAAVAALSQPPATATLGADTIVGLDLSVGVSAPASAPALRVNGFGHEDGGASIMRKISVDHGYNGDMSRSTSRDTEDGDDADVRSFDEQAQRNYLSGPIDDLVESLPRPSPLSRNVSSLPSPALSTSTSSSSIHATAELSQPPSGPHHHSRPSSIRRDREDHYAPLLDSTPSRPRPRAFTLSHSAFGSFGTFPSTARSGPIPAPTLISRVRLFFLQLFANAASAAFLALIVVWALSDRGFRASLRWWRGERDIRDRRDWDDDERRKLYEQEKVVKDIQYYALQCGFDCIEQTVETKDGYLLKVFKVECLKPGKEGKIHSDGRKGFPVLIQHGLFQSCGSFITSEERSLAFWLAEHGDYQVYLGNNRGVFDMGHVRLKRSDPRFWDYNIKELALYDLPAMVDHIRRETGYDKIAFIGHSQGNATMFCSLAQGMVPELGSKLSIFIALAPAVYAGPLTTGFPFGALKSMKWRTWRRWFGVLDFIPLMRISYNWTPSKPFGLLGYQMFAFLFNWTDRNWLLRRKAKTFRFTPSPVSSASIFWWTGYGGFSTRGCVLDPSVDKWFDSRFPPLSIHHGGRDYLVLTEPLLERLKTHEKDVKLIRVQKMDEGEHCDFFWHIDAVELCFNTFLEDIEATRPRYIDESDDEDNEHQMNEGVKSAASTIRPAGTHLNGNGSARTRSGKVLGGR